MRKQIRKELKALNSELWCLFIRRNLKKRFCLRQIRSIWWFKRNLSKIKRLRILNLNKKVFTLLLVRNRKQWLLLNQKLNQNLSFRNPKKKRRSLNDHLFRNKLRLKFQNRWKYKLLRMMNQAKRRKKLDLTKKKRNKLENYRVVILAQLK